MKKTLSILMAAILFLSVLTACGSGTQANPTNPSAEESAAVGTPTRTDVVIGINKAIDSLEPMTAIQREEQMILANVFDTLIEYKEGNYVASLAESYTLSDDGKSMTIKLHDNVLFHNGEKLTTKDVAYTLDHMKDYTYYTSFKDNYDRTEIIDDLNCIVYAPYVTPQFLVTLSAVSIINQKAIETNGTDDKFNPVGTGPYKFISYDGFNKVVLERNDEYFKGASDLEKVTFRIITDAQTLAMSLEAGEIDIVGSVDAANEKQFEGNDKFNVIWKDADGIQLLLFQMNHEPFDNKLVRQAISYAIDRESMNLIAADGKASVRDAFYSDKMVGAPDYSNIKHYDYNLEKAKELLTEAGFPDGFTLEEPVRVIEPYKNLAVVLKEQLSKVGINFEIEVLEANALFNDYLFVGKYNMMPFSFSTEIYDMSYATKFFLSPDKAGPYNMTGYSSAEADKLISEGETAPKIEDRVKAYTELFNLLQEDMSICAIMESKVAEISNKDLVNDDAVLARILVSNLHWQR